MRMELPGVCPTLANGSRIFSKGKLRRAGPLLPAFNAEPPRGRR